MKNSALTLMAILSLLLNSATAQTPELWGMTSEGGNDNGGVIFKTDTNGLNQSVVYSFDIIEGTSFVGEPCEAANGKLYGMTSTGGTFGFGIIYEYDPSNNAYKKLFDFNSIGGKLPLGSLIQASNGKFYGMTSQGGTNDLGTLFEFNIVNNTFNKKIDFDGINKGSNPEGSLVQASNGKLYGMTPSGGSDYQGVLFDFNPNNYTFNKILNFTGNNGSKPHGSLIEASNGKLYGLTREGGIGNSGILFEYTLSQDTVIVKYKFGPANGRYPNGSLMQASNGKLYGLTSRGGTDDKGTIFKYNLSSSVLTKLYDFDNASGGFGPQGSLTEDINGKLYGFAKKISSYSSIIYEYDFNTGVYTNKTDGGHNGYSFMKTSGGTMYAVYIGIFIYTPVDNSITYKVSSQTYHYGSEPKGRLLKASNGKLYGMTWGGGVNSKGVLFEYDTVTNELIKKLDFDGAEKGENPMGSLMQASNGKLYGMTWSGGTNDKGVLFEFNVSTNTYTKKTDFNETNGSNPYGGLTETSNGKLYGMTERGGSNSRGVLFEYTPSNNILTVVFNFADAVGTDPYGSLIQASNGKLYGMTLRGGTNNKGVLFEFDPATNTYTKKVDFDITNGASPYGSLTEASNGKLYGMTSSGGTNNEGVLFEYDIATNILTKKLDFDDVDKGKTPKGSLMQASNGKLYGMTYDGGINDMGVMFEYDIDSDTYTKTLDYDGTNGKYPMYGHLIELADTPPTNTTVQNVTLSNGESECYNATNTITVAGEGTTVVIRSGGEATFIAGGKILFKPGFSSLSGSYTTAQITTTNNYCNAQQNMAAAQNNNSPETANETVTFDELINDNTKLNIYPNPTSGNFTVSFSDKAASAEIALYSLQGNMLYKVSCKETLKQEIDISHFETGMYIIIIKTGKKVITGKVIKNN